MIDNKNLQVGDVILSVKDLCKYFGNNKVLTGINIDIKKGDVVAIVGPSGCGKSTFLRCLNLLETPNAGEIVFEGDYVYKLYSLYTKEAINEVKLQIKEYKNNKQEVPNELTAKLKQLEEEYSEKKLEEKLISKTIQKGLNVHRQKIGMVFQHFNLFNNKNIISNISLAPNHVQLSKMRKIARKNLFIKIGNLFRKKENKKELLINRKRKEILDENKENALNLLKKIGLEDKAEVYPSTWSAAQKQRIAKIRA